MVTILLQVVFHAQIGKENGEYNIDDVINAVCRKLIHRHPHVFGDVQADTAAKVIRQWDKIKEEVEGRKSDSVLDSVPNGFPPLLKAYKMLKKAAKSGFDWPSVELAESKVREELEEISGAIKENNQEHLEEEAGDMLLAAVNYCRKLGVDPNVALEKAAKKFSCRFRFVEKKMKEKGLVMEEKNDAEMLALWKEAKKL